MKMRILIALATLGVCAVSVTIYAQNGNYTYQQDILPVLSANNCTSCHSWASNYESLMSLTSTNAPTGVAIVSASDPDSSMIVWRLEGETADGDPIGQMPKGGTPLSTDTIQVVRDWIAHGALFDDTVGLKETTWGEMKSEFR